VKLYLIVDVAPYRGEARRTAAQILEDIEAAIEVDVDVLNDSSLASLHQVKVLGIGKSVDAAKESERLRRG
jgi:hypothetical protein